MEISIIDDDKIYQRLMTKILKRIDKDIIVKTYYNGEEAFRDLQNNTCSSQIVLLDINMPKMNGWQFLEKINKNTFKNTSVYLATSSIDYRDKEKAKNFEILKGYLVKPISKKKILEITQNTN